MKTCLVCGIEIKSSRHYCDECNKKKKKESSDKYYAAHREKVIENAKKYYFSVKDSERYKRWKEIRNAKSRLKRWKNRKEDLMERLSVLDKKIVDYEKKKEYYLAILNRIYIDEERNNTENRERLAESQNQA